MTWETVRRNEGRMLRQYVTRKLFDAAYVSDMWDRDNWNRNGNIPLDCFGGKVSDTLLNAAQQLAAENVSLRRGRGYVYPEGPQIGHDSSGPVTIQTERG